MTSSATFPPILVFDAVSGEYRDPSDSADTTAKVDAPTRTVLVTGASGLLGRQVQLQFARAGWKAVGTGLHRINPPDVVSLNITSPSAINTLLDDLKPDVVVHCAANRFPDSCTADPAGARNINVEASHSLAEATIARDIFLIYISTDYVFSGQPGEAPYSATSPPNPPNVYGRTKLEGERAVLDAAANAGVRNKTVALRVPILYGPCDEPSQSAVNVLMSQLWAAQKLSPSDPKIEIDDYALRYPTNTQDVGRVCRDIADFYRSSENRDRELPTVLQFSSEECLTKWGIVNVFAEITGLPFEGLVPSRPKEGEDVTVRPYDCHLGTSELRELGIDVSTVGFKEWWSKELGVFQR